MKISFTQRYLEGVAAKGKRYVILDAQTKGLGIVVFPSGVKSFFHVRKVRGYPERRTLGQFPELSLDVARGKASDLNGKLARWKANDYEGASPVARDRGVLTLAGLIEQYVARQVQPNAKDAEKAAKNVYYLVDPYLASWKARPITSIQRKDVSELLAELGRKRGQVVANRVVQLLKRVFNFGEREEIFSGQNPARGHKLFRERSRKRFITGDEMPRFLAAVDAERNRDLRDFVYVALFTGVRMGDTLSMRWSDVDLDQAVWTIPNTTKTGESYAVALVPKVVEILRTRPHLSDEWVFPSWGASGHRKAPKVAWGLLCDRAGIADLHIHDLRRSLGSWQAAQGTSLPVIAKALGHVSTAATQVYARMNLEPVRAAVQSATDAMLATRGKIAVVPTPTPRKKGAKVG